MLELELVLPAYNEANSLDSLIDRVIEAAKSAGFTPERFQLIVVENGSTDHSSQVLSDIKSGDRGVWFRSVAVAQNQGYGNGLFLGLNETSAPFVAWSHADLQCDPADVFRAYQLLLDSKNSKVIVKGVRHGRGMRDVFVSRVFETLARIILGCSGHEMNAQPKVFPRTVIGCLKAPPKTFAFDLYFIYSAQKHGFHFVTLPVEFSSRVHGASKWAAHFASRYKTILGIIVYMFRLLKTEGRL